jgi:hypothetical protein
MAEEEEERDRVNGIEFREQGGRDGRCGLRRRRGSMGKVGRMANGIVRSGVIPRARGYDARRAFDGAGRGGAGEG